jgi:hypothetical protein
MIARTNCGYSAATLKSRRSRLPAGLAWLRQAQPPIAEGRLSGTLFHSVGCTAGCLQFAGGPAATAPSKLENYFCSS